MMDEKARFDAGMKKRRKVLGDAWVDRSIERKSAFNEEFLEFITRYAWGEIWTRPGLDERTRRLIVLGSCVAMGRWEEFRLHLRAAIVEGGVAKDDVKELLLQQAVYCGVPAANTAFNEAAHVFAEIEKEKRG
jgi:4-carboxymuconolactone decarboxylase